MPKIALQLLTLVLALLAGSAYAADKGYFGFSIAVDTEGFSFNPTLKSVTINGITPGSPAQLAGLISGDQFVEVEGHVVAGSKANEIKPFLSRNVGETVDLKVKKASGEIVSITLTSAKRP
jgi:C-terminal processing protease CtpA/Prc